VSGNEELGRGERRADFQGRTENKTMPFDWSAGALAEGLQCYRNGKFFDAHEHWEGVWLMCKEPEKTFLQALIQITAAFHHLQRGNPAGTRSLLRRASRRLERYPEEFGGVPTETLRHNIRDWLTALEKENEPLHLPLPAIRSTQE